MALKSLFSLLSLFLRSRSNISNTQKGGKIQRAKNHWRFKRFLNDALVEVIVMRKECIAACKFLPRKPTIEFLKCTKKGKS